MIRNKRHQEVESNFNRKETFDMNHVPKYFDSVKNSSLRKIKRNTIEKIAYNTKFDPGALEMALKSTDGQFSPAYKVLESDYGARLANLKKAYRNGLKSLRAYVKRYELQVEQHNAAFERCNEANQIIEGDKLSESLKVSPIEVENYKKAIDRLAKKLQ